MEYPEYIERLLGHALLADVDYRIWLVEDPKAAAASIGIKLSDAEANYIHTHVTRRRLHGVARSVSHWKPHIGLRWEDPGP